MKIRYLLLFYLTTMFLISCASDKICKTVCRPDEQMCRVKCKDFEEWN